MGDILQSEELVDEPSDYGALKPGTRLGRYELLVPIARGGMARVWAARLHGQRGFQKLVAIKTILPHLARETEFERMFLDEARIASGVHHPNVCEIYELGEEQRVLYLAMEWVTGDSFSRVLRSSGRTEPVDPRVVARIIADACAGLHSAHELTDDVGRQLGVVHRDLSPHNILLTADGVAKVADFGVAKALGQLHEQTSAGQLKGKVAYMSPEQISGTGIDRRSDVFSLGCVLYESTTGERPFKGDNDAQIMHAVLKGEFKHPSEIIRGYPKELEHIVTRAMSPQAIVRFPTAERMRFALEEYLTRGPLVTQSNVAQVVRARIGEHLERRRERIRQASTVGDQGSFDAGPREKQPDAHRSGVKQAKPMHATLPLGAPIPGAGAAESQPPQGYSPQGQPQHGYTPSPYSPSNVRQAGTGTNIPGLHMTGPQIPGPQMQHTPHPPPALMMPTPLDATRIHEYSNPALARPPGMHGMAPNSAPTSNRNPMGGPMGAPPDGEEQGANHTVLAAVIGVVFAVMIGTGGFLIWKSQQIRREQSQTPAPSATASSSAAPSAVVSAPSSAAAVAARDITFKITPPEATIAMDGKELDPTMRTLPRPAAGTTVPVVIRAPGYEDQTSLIDYFTASPYEVSLKKAAASDPTPTPPPSAEPAAKVDPPKDDTTPDPKPKPKPKPKTDPVLPPNPF